MKKITLLFLSLLTFSAFAQIEVVQSGRVGIGTSTPTSLLHLLGDSPILKLQNNAHDITENNFFAFLTAHDKNGLSSWWLGEGSSGGKTLGFYGTQPGYSMNLFNNGGGISIIDGGNVGIGTTSPDAGLEVRSNDGIKIASEDYTGWKSSIKMVDGLIGTSATDDMLFSTSGGFMFKMDDNNNGISNVQGFNIYDRNNNSVFTIRESDGYVGIGKTPSQKLDVNGSIKASGNIAGNRFYIGGDVVMEIDGNFLRFAIDPDLPSTIFTNKGIRTLGNVDPHVDLVASLGTASLRWNEIYANNIDLSGNATIDGNVGIGTIDTFGEKLAVNGKIIAKDMIVGSQTQHAWPDYVFEKDYNLLSLEEVERHIKEKGHLPNIPSAKEVKEKGSFSLGEMNKKLLEKVEELMLYTIQQEKEIKKIKNQEERIKKIEEENKKLKSLLERVTELEKSIKK